MARKRHRMVLQRPAGESRDARGHVKPIYADAGFVYASIKQRTAAEDQDQPQVTSRALFDILAYYREDLAVTTDWRIVHLGQVYNILTVDNVDGQNRNWVFTCEVDTSPRGEIGEPA